MAAVRATRKVRPPDLVPYPPESELSGVNDKGFSPRRLVSAGRFTAEQAPANGCSPLSRRRLSRAMSGSNGHYCRDPTRAGTPRSRPTSPMCSSRRAGGRGPRRGPAARGTDAARKQDWEPTPARHLVRSHHRHLQPVWLEPVPATTSELHLTPTSPAAWFDVRCVG